MDDEELLQLAREAGFESLDDVEDTLQRARMGLEEYEGVYGWQVTEAGRGPGGMERRHRMAARTRAEAERLSERAAELEEAVAAAYARGYDDEAEQLDVELDDIYERLDQLGMELEEGGEETHVGEQSRGDQLEAELAELYYMATAHPMYSRDEEHASGRTLQKVLRMETGRRVSRDRALQIGREAFEARQERRLRMRRQLEERVGVPEHVRVEHELARMRAARVPPELARALGYEPLRPNLRPHPVVEATIESLRDGVSPSRALGVPLSAGLPLVLSRRVVRECRLWIEYYSS